MCIMCTRSSTKPTETDRLPAAGLPHNKQTDPELEELEELLWITDMIQEPHFPPSDFQHIQNYTLKQD